jgi:hypothetical protein
MVTSGTPSGTPAGRGIRVAACSESRSFIERHGCIRADRARCAAHRVGFGTIFKSRERTMIKVSIPDSRRTGGRRSETTIRRIFAR